MTRLLIETGCDVNNADNRGETIMHTAVMNAALYPEGIDNSARLIQLILDRKPDLSVWDSSGYRPRQSKRKHRVLQECEPVLSRLKDHGG